MCQAYAAEAAYIRSGEDWATKKGFAAHRDNLPITENPYMSGYYKEAWDHGWNCRKEGIVPWSITSLFREKQEEKTGKSCYENPTIEQADALV